MLTTIRDLLRLALPPGSVLHTNEASATSHVRTIVGARATLPAFPPLRGGELALVIPAQVLAIDERLTVPHLIERLAAVPIAGLAIVGPVEPHWAERANRRQIALLELPTTVDLQMLQRDFNRLLADPELQMERRAAQLYTELTQALVAGGGVRSVVGLLAERTGQCAACYSASGRLRAERGQGPGLAAFQLIQRPTAGEHQYLGQQVLIRTIGELGGLALAGPTLDNWDILALDQAVAAFALEVAKEQAVKAAESRVRGDLLRTILSGALVDPASLHAQASELGFDLERQHVAVVWEPLEWETGRLLGQLQRFFRRHTIAAPLMQREETVVAFWPINEHNDLRDMLHTFEAEGEMTVGYSNPTTSPFSWPRALDEAEQALLLGQQLFGPQSITAFADLGVYRLLLAQRDAPDLWRFYRDTLGSLVDHDGETGELVGTLEGYFAELGNVSRAAERLHIHRNTLIYRLQRISEITGIDWKHAEDQLALQLALKAHRVLRLLDASGRNGATRKG